MKKLMSYLLSLCLAVSLAPGGLTVKAATVKAEDGTVIRQADTPDQLMKLSEADVDGGQTLLIDPADGSVETEVGEKAEEYDTIGDRLPMTRKQEAALTEGSEKENKEEMEEYLEDSGVCLVDEENGKLAVNFPFGLKRIIVRSSSLSDTHDAETAVYYSGTQEYLLTYQTDEQTRDAYEAFCREYGETSVILDLPVETENVTAQDQPLVTAKSDDTTSWQSWGVYAMRLNDLKQQTDAGSGSGKITVAVIDTGINSGHEMFSGRKILSSSKSFVITESAIKDYNGHGTHVAGTIVDGTSSQIQLLILKALNRKRTGSMRDILSAVEYATLKGADVINMSLGMAINDFIGEKDYDLNMIINTSTYVKYANLFFKMAKDSGAVLCAASGNSGSNLDTALEYPAASPYVLAVGAIDSYGYTANFSNYGSVDFAAPGVSILSASNSSNTKCVYMDGTSMACPHISAAAAMVKLYHPTYNQAKVASLLASHCYDIGSSGKDKYSGYGMPVMNFLSGSHNVSGTGSSPAKVTGLKAKALVKGVRLTWKKSSGASGYMVYRKQGSIYLPVKVVSGTTTTIMNLVPANNYIFCVTAYKTANGKRYYSSKSSVVAKRPLLAATKKIKKTRKKGAVKLSWKKVAYASGYGIFRSTKKNKGFKRVALTKKRSALIKGKKGKTYYYIVKAYRKVGGKKYYGLGRKIKAKNK